MVHRQVSRWPVRTMSQTENNQVLLPAIEKAGCKEKRHQLFNVASFPMKGHQARVKGHVVRTGKVSHCPK